MHTLLTYYNTFNKSISTIRVGGEYIMVVHARIKDLASGFLKVAGKQVTEVRDALVKTGKSKAIDIACKAIEGRTGLPNSICRRAGELVVNTLVREVKDKLK